MPCKTSSAGHSRDVHRPSPQIPAICDFFAASAQTAHFARDIGTPARCLTRGKRRCRARTCTSLPCRWPVRQWPLGRIGANPAGSRMTAMQRRVLRRRSARPRGRTRSFAAAVELATAGSAAVQAARAALLALRGRRRRRLPARPRDPAHQGADRATARELRPWLHTVIKHEALALRRQRERAVAAEDAPRCERPRAERPTGPGGAGGGSERARRTRGGARHAEAERAAVPAAEGARVLLRRDLGTHRLQLDQGEPLPDRGRRRFFERFGEIASGDACEPLPAAAVRRLRRSRERRGRRTLRAHLAACSGCRAALRGFRVCARATWRSCCPRRWCSRCWSGRVCGRGSATGSRHGGGERAAASAQAPAERGDGQRAEGGRRRGVDRGDRRRGRGGQRCRPAGQGPPHRGRKRTSRAEPTAQRAIVRATPAASRRSRDLAVRRRRAASPRRKRIAHGVRVRLRERRGGAGRLVEARGGRPLRLPDAPLPRCRRSSPRPAVAAPPAEAVGSSGHDALHRRALIVCALAIAGPLAAARAGTYDVYACGGAAGAAQQRIRRVGRREHERLLDLPAAQRRRNRHRHEGHPPTAAWRRYLARARTRSSTRRPAPCSQSVTFNVGAIRLHDYWSTGIVAFDGDFNAGDLPYGCYPFMPGAASVLRRSRCARRSPSTTARGFRFETRCGSRSGCPTLASGFTPGNRALFSAADVAVRVEDWTLPSLFPHARSAVANGLASRLRGGLDRLHGQRRGDGHAA